MDYENSPNSSITHEQSFMMILNPPIKIFKLTVTNDQEGSILNMSDFLSKILI